MNVNVILTRQNLPEAIEYHCIRCTRKMFTINRNILVLWIGDNYPAMEVPMGMGWVRHKCRGCENVYNYYFQ